MAFPVVPGPPGSSVGAGGKNDLFMMKRQRDVGGEGGGLARAVNNQSELRAPALNHLAAVAAAGRWCKSQAD